MWQKFKYTIALLLISVTAFAVTYTTKVYHERGGNRVVVASGGEIDIEEGGTLQFDGMDQIKCVDTTIATADVLTLNATAQTLVAAQGANTAIIPKRLVFWLDYNSVAYNGVAANEDLALKYTNSAGTQIGQAIETTGFIDQTNDEIRIVYDLGSSTASGAALVVEPTANAAVVLHLLNDEIATGNSPLKVRTCYEVLPTSF